VTAVLGGRSRYQRHARLAARTARTFNRGEWGLRLGHDAPPKWRRPTRLTRAAVVDGSVIYAAGFPCQRDGTSDGSSAAQVSAIPLPDVGATVLRVVELFEQQSANRHKAPLKGTNRCFEIVPSRRQHSGKNRISGIERVAQWESPRFTETGIRSRVCFCTNAASGPALKLSAYRGRPEVIGASSE
jgi:hypothetical protein